MSDNNNNDEEVKAKNSNLDFIDEIIDQEMNHVVRQDEDLKGMFNIQVKANNSFNIKLYSGTQGEARVIEDVSKDKLLSLMEDKL